MVILLTLSLQSIRFFFAALLPTTSVFPLQLHAVGHTYLSGILITHLYCNASYCISDCLHNLTKLLCFLILYSDGFAPFCFVWKFNNVFCYTNSKWRYSSVSDAGQVCIETDLIHVSWQTTHSVSLTKFSNCHFYFTAVSTRPFISTFLKKNIAIGFLYWQASYSGYRRQPDGAEILTLKINYHYGILEPFSVCLPLTLQVLLAGFSSAYVHNIWSNSTAFMFGM